MDSANLTDSTNNSTKGNVMKGMQRQLGLVVLTASAVVTALSAHANPQSLVAPIAQAPSSPAPTQAVPRPTAPMTPEMPGTAPSAKPGTTPANPTVPMQTPDGRPMMRPVAPGASTPGPSTPGTSATPPAPTAPARPTVQTPASPATPATPRTAATGTIADVAGASSTFTTLVSALNEAELTEVLKGEGPFTVFAPTDAAFEALPPGTIDELMKPENRTTLVQVLKYHVVSGAYPASRLAAGQLPSVQGAPITVSITDGKVMVNDANVLQADITATNGVIHAIDRVILPPRP